MWTVKVMSTYGSGQQSYVTLFFFPGTPAVKHSPATLETVLHLWGFIFTIPLLSLLVKFCSIFHVLACSCRLTQQSGLAVWTWNVSSRKKSKYVYVSWFDSIRFVSVESFKEIGFYFFAQSLTWRYSFGRAWPEQEVQCNNMLHNLAENFSLPLNRKIICWLYRILTCIWHNVCMLFYILVDTSAKWKNNICKVSLLFESFITSFNRAFTPLWKNENSL